jgi:CheY-like chemotaxis protein
LKLARLLRPDLIIADVMLSALDGIELLRAVRRDPQLDGTAMMLWSAVYQPHQIRAIVNQDCPFVALDKQGDLDELTSKVNDVFASAKKRPRKSDTASLVA